MKLVVLFGPPAVGKMTVGYELEKLTGLRLFHNHMTIELVLHFFDFGTPPFGRLVDEFRRRIFEEVAASDLPGLIFTYVWALDDPGDREFIETTCEIFRSHGAEWNSRQTWMNDSDAMRQSFACPKNAPNAISRSPEATCMKPSECTD